MSLIIQFSAFLIVATLAGCGSSPPAKFYTLSSIAMPSQMAKAVQYHVAVSAVTVPDIVNRPQVVTRAGGNQVTLDEFARWAEPLKTEIPRVIANDLGGLLDDARVTAYPQIPNADTDFRVTVDVQRFDSVLDEAAVVEVLWAVKGHKAGQKKSGRSTVHETVNGTGYEALVAAHSRALATVSREIASAIVAMRATQSNE